MKSFAILVLLLAIVSSAAFKLNNLRAKRESGNTHIVLPTVSSSTTSSNSTFPIAPTATSTQTYASLTWNYEYRYEICNNVPILLETRTLHLTLNNECNIYLQKDSFDRATNLKSRVCTKTKCGTTAAENQDCNNSYYLWDPTQMNTVKLV